MSIELCILASGSSGNASVVRTPRGAMLIDAGIGPRTTAQRLAGTGVKLSDLSAIVLTHLDRDHFSPSWLRTILNNNIRVHCHKNRISELLMYAEVEQSKFESLVAPFGTLPFFPLEELQLQPVSLAHDEEGSHGFVVEGFHCRLGYATDLGHVPKGLLDRFSNLDVLAIEANYDPQMQLASARPWFLKQRIMGGSGHLSNEQALVAICQILDRAQASGARLPAHIALLHRSRQCNCPKLLRKLFSQDPRIASRLTLAHQYERSEWLSVRPAPRPHEQLTLAWS